MLRYFQIPGAVIFRVTGKDSQRYLNARLSNDIKALVPPAGCLAAMLNAQGRTEGLFAVLHPEPGEYYLVCDGGDAARVEAALKKFIVADRVNVENLSAEFSLVHILDIPPGSPLLSAFGAGESPEADFAAVRNGNFLVYGRKRSASRGVDILTDAPLRKNLMDLLARSGTRELDQTDRLCLRLKAGIAEFPAEINEDRLFSESGMRHAVSFKKGCYVGQEVVEKIDSHGKSPKLLKALCVEAADVKAGADVLIEETAGERSIGKIVSSCYDQDSNLTYCLATLRNEPGLDQSKLSVNGRSTKINDRGFNDYGA